MQLPPRDTRNIEKAEKKQAEDVARGRELRLSAGHDDDPATPADGPRRTTTGTRTADRTSSPTKERKGLLGRLRGGR